MAVFNLEDKESEVNIPWSAVSEYGISGRAGRELWSGEDAAEADRVSVPAHGAKLYRLER